MRTNIQAEIKTIFLIICFVFLKIKNREVKKKCKSIPSQNRKKGLKWGLNYSQYFRIRVVSYHHHK